MTAPLEASGAVELAVVERSGFIESRHVGVAIVIDEGGHARAQHGDVDAAIFPRSTLKLMQAVAMLRSGLDLTGAELVLAAASHIGTERHTAVVTDILAGAGLDAAALQCPEAWPADAASRAEATAPHRITMGCSGKHAAMLATCVINGWPTETYLDPEHPLQQRIRSTIEEFAGPISHTGVDGCGTPVFAITLRGLATAIGAIARGSDPHAAALTTAILDNPWALDTATVERIITDLGIIAKTGAEGIFVAATTDGTAVALKVLDGSSRALVPVGLSLLADAGAIDPDRAALISAETTEHVRGAGRVVGELRSVV